MARNTLKFNITHHLAARLMNPPTKIKKIWANYFAKGMSDKNSTCMYTFMFYFFAESKPSSQQSVKSEPVADNKENMDMLTTDFDEEME